jgi:hypothetical protein
MKAYIYILLFLLCLTSAIAQYYESDTYNVTNDIYIKRFEPWTNWDSQVTLSFRGTSWDVIDILVTVDVAAAIPDDASSIKDIELYYKLQSTSSYTSNAIKMNQTVGFDETTATWSNINGSDVMTLNDTVFTISGDYIKFNITDAYLYAMAQGYSNVSYRFHTNDDDLLFRLHRTEYPVMSSSRPWVNFSYYTPAAILNISILDEITEAAVSETVTVIGVSDDYVFNYTTATGTLDVELPYSGDYELIYFASSYDERHYFISLDDTDEEEVTLYLINSSESTRVFHTVYDQTGNVADGIYVRLLKYFPTTNTYSIVSMAKSNYEGEVMFYAEMYDAYYRMIYLTEDGEIGTTSPSAFLDTTSNNKVNLEDDAFKSWQLYDNVYHNVSWINSSGDVYARFIYMSADNIVRAGCLKVELLTTEGLSVICNNCTNSASATLTCNINESLKGQYKAIAFIDTNTTGSWYSIDLEWYNLITESFDFGQNGAFMAFLLIGTIALIGISSVAGAIVMLIVGVIAVSVLGLVAGLNYGFIMLFATIGLIVLFLARKSTE